MGGMQEIERWRKKFFDFFQKEGLKITFEGGSKSVEFLDVVFDLSSSSYFPYVKPNTSTNYVSVQSNHPKCVIQSIPKGIAKRLSTNSSSSEEFHNHTGHFKEALSKAG